MRGAAEGSGDGHGHTKKSRTVGSRTASKRAKDKLADWSGGGLVDSAKADGAAEEALAGLGGGEREAGARAASPHDDAHLSDTESCESSVVGDHLDLFLSSDSDGDDEAEQGEGSKAKHGTRVVVCGQHVALPSCVIGCPRFSSFLNMDVWHSLDDKDKQRLMEFLPASPCGQSKERAVALVLSKANVFFGNALDKAWTDLQCGALHPHTQLYRLPLLATERALHAQRVREHSAAIVQALQWSKCARTIEVLRIYSNRKTFPRVPTTRSIDHPIPILNQITVPLPHRIVDAIHLPAVRGMSVVQSTAAPSSPKQGPSGKQDNKSKQSKPSQSKKRKAPDPSGNAKQRQPKSGGRLKVKIPQAVVAKQEDVLATPSLPSATPPVQAAAARAPKTSRARQPKVPKGEKQKAQKRSPAGRKPPKGSRPPEHLPHPSYATAPGASPPPSPPAVVVPIAPLVPGVGSFELGHAPGLVGIGEHDGRVGLPRPAPMALPSAPQQVQSSQEQYSRPSPFMAAVGAHAVLAAQSVPRAHIPSSVQSRAPLVVSPQRTAMSPPSGLAAAQPLVGDNSLSEQWMENSRESWGDSAVHAATAPPFQDLDPTPAQQQQPPSDDDEDDYDAHHVGTLFEFGEDE